MFLLDINVLIALAWPKHVHHDRAHRWFVAIGTRPWATTPLTELSFVRLSANPLVVHRPVAVADSIAALNVIRRMDGHAFIADDGSLATPVISLERLASPRQLTDLHLVNIAARNQAVLVTFDRAIATYLQPSDQRHLSLID